LVSFGRTLANRRIEPTPDSVCDGVAAARGSFAALRDCRQSSKPDDRGMSLSAYETLDGFAKSSGRRNQTRIL
jgi:hypothetical protein